MRKQINPKHRTQSQFWIRIQSQQIPDYGVTRKKKTIQKEIKRADDAKRSKGTKLHREREALLR